MQQRNDICYGVSLLVGLLSWVGVPAQRISPSPFQYLQFGFLDSTAALVGHRDFLYPASLVAMNQSISISAGKLLEVPGWNQLNVQLLKKKKQTAGGVQFSYEKMAGCYQLQLGIQVAQSLGDKLTIGTGLGMEQTSYLGYKKTKVPFAKLGLQTNLSENLLVSFSLCMARRFSPVEWKKNVIESSLLAATQLNISPSIAAVLHIQKNAYTPLEWMTLLYYQPTSKISFQGGCSPAFQWWVFQVAFLHKLFKTQLGLGLHPLVGSLSSLSFQLPSMPYEK